MEDKQKKELLVFLNVLVKKDIKELTGEELEFLDGLSALYEKKERMTKLNDKMLGTLEEIDKKFEELDIQENQKVLECSTKGDRRFSAMVAKVKVGSETKTIEEHYQLSKRFKVDEMIFIPKTKWDSKGKKDVIFFEVLGKRYEPKYLTAYFTLLWVKYLDNNPSLVKYAKGFEDFSDMFKGSSVNCQASIIRDYIKKGRKYLTNDPLVKEFNLLMKQPHCVRIVNGNLLTSNMNVIGHQVNCKGVMGAGIALQIKNHYPKVFAEYKNLCTKHFEGQGLMGKCQVVSESGEIITHKSFIKKKEDRLVANLFGQNGFGIGLQTEYSHLKTSLVELKLICKEHDLWVGLPYNLGSGLAGGDWDKVISLIEDVFHDYPITIFKLEE